jgi:LuxR family maltose regulon positive regulatory protein
MRGMTHWIKGHARYLRQVVEWWAYDPKKVIEAADSMLALKHESTQREVIDTYLCKALSLRELNSSDEAKKVLSKAIKFIEHYNDPSALNLVRSCQARLNIAEGNLDAATKWFNETDSSSLDPTMVFWVEVPAITRCRVLIAKGTTNDLQQALELLSQYRIYSESVFNKLRIIEVIVLQAVALRKLGKQEDAISALKHAVELVGKGEWIRPFAEQEKEISDMLLHLKETGVNPGFIDQIFKAIEKTRNTASKTRKDATVGAKKENLTLFTSRELDVLGCIAEGLRNQEIGEKLFVSEETIKKHINNMFQKINVKNRLSLVTRAREEGILK